MITFFVLSTQDVWLTISVVTVKLQTKHCKATNAPLILRPPRNPWFVSFSFFTFSASQVFNIKATFLLNFGNFLQANFARWEPVHGKFNFGHPWAEYVKVGASLRSCAYCIEALNGSMNSEAKVLDLVFVWFV